MIATPHPVVLTMRDVQKSFGSNAALDGVDLTVHRGEVHALIGENGAGKSTLMKVLSGAYAKDGGSMELEGDVYLPMGPEDARARGVVMIYQELCLAPHLTVSENILLGRERSRFGFVRRDESRELVTDVLEILDHPELTPDRRVAELAPGPRQMVEVARALVDEAKVIVLDEPTSSLAARDTERLFAIIELLRDRGTAIVYISHFLEEVYRIGDRFTVLRDGRTVGAGDLSETKSDQIIRWMVGRSLEEIFPKVPHDPGEVVLKVTDLKGERLPKRVNMELRRGEILGIAGLVGAGRTELLRVLFGLDPMASGEVRRMGGEGSSVTREATHASPAARLADGVGMLSENRKEEGLLLNQSIAVNTTLSRLSPFVRFGWLSLGSLREVAKQWIERLGVRCASEEQPVGELSGGNQQKVAIARLLHHDVEVFLLDEPTRGIDVASKAEVYRWMGELAAAGKSVLFVSSYIPELLGVCDRIAVMHRGELMPARPVSLWSEHEILDEASRGAGVEQ